MKKQLINYIFEIPVFAMAGVGLMTSVQHVLSDSETLPVYLILFGLIFGLLIWRMETRSVKILSRSSSDRITRLYIYVSTTIIYVLSVLGILEVIYHFSGDIRLTARDLLSLQGLLVLLPYVAAWMTTVDNMIKESINIDQ